VHPSITNEMASLALSGLVIVFSVLALIAAAVGLLKKLDDRWQDHERRLDKEALEKKPTIDDTTLVLITAAAAAVVQGRFRVRRIHRLLSPRRQRTPWSSQGRMTLQGSHAVRRRRS